MVAIVQCDAMSERCRRSKWPTLSCHCSCGTERKKNNNLCWIEKVSLFRIFLPDIANSQNGIRKKKIIVRITQAVQVLSQPKSGTWSLKSTATLCGFPVTSMIIVDWDQINSELIVVVVVFYVYIYTYLAYCWIYRNKFHTCITKGLCDELHMHRGHEAIPCLTDRGLRKAVVLGIIPMWIAFIHGRCARAPQASMNQHFTWSNLEYVTAIFATANRLAGYSKADQKKNSRWHHVFNTLYSKNKIALIQMKIYILSLILWAGKMTVAGLNRL